MNKDLFKSPIRRFIETKINGGAILLFVALIAMIIANSPLENIIILYSPRKSYSNSVISVFSIATATT